VSIAMRALLSTVLAIATVFSCRTAAAESGLPPKSWEVGWSGSKVSAELATDRASPLGDQVVRWTWTPSSGDLPTMRRSFEPVGLAGDIVAFWFRVSKPVSRLQVVLTDVNGVGAENSVPAIVRAPTLEPNRWHLVVWQFRAEPGWIRYQRAVVDWSKIAAFGFQTWADQVRDGLTIEMSQPRVMTYDELDRLSTGHPEIDATSRAVAWRVLPARDASTMMDRYYDAHAEALTTRLRRRTLPSRSPAVAADIRRDLRAAYLMPASKAVAEALLVRVEQIDGISVEIQLLKTREGVYSPAAIFRPPDSFATVLRHPGLLMLPGHGDPDWSSSVQSRCLAYARRGFVVMLVQPFGQGERGDDPRWAESHDSQSAAYLLPTGQSLLGLIQADHESEVAYLRSRSDVDPEKVAVTGVSMGATHSLWLAAIDENLRAGVIVAAGPLYEPRSSLRHMGLCDLIFGAYQVADMELIRSLVAPRPLLQIYPSSEVPLTQEGEKLFGEGRISQREAADKYSRNETQLTLLHRYSHDVYRAMSASKNLGETIVDGSHDYNAAMLAAGADFLDTAFGVRAGSRSQADLHPITDTARAVEALTIWGHGNRPRDFLSPTQYVQRRAAELIGHLPPVPTTVAGWTDLRRSLRSKLRELLKVPLESPSATSSELPSRRSERGRVRRLVAHPEPGIDLPMLLFEPDDGVRPDGRIVALLDPEGMLRPASSEERRRLTAEGARVLCVGLRGTGETRSPHEAGGYLGFRDLDLATSALTLGDTLAGYWVKDLLAAIRIAKQRIDTKSTVTVRATREMALVAILAAAESNAIDAVDARGLLASYYSAGGYGLPFAYSDAEQHTGVRTRHLGGYGSMLPCIPHLLEHADVAELAALVSPRPLALIDPEWASGEPLGASESDLVFAWTRAAYGVDRSSAQLSLLMSSTADQTHQ
jgi:dienelactone hydrolase